MEVKGDFGNQPVTFINLLKFPNSYDQRRNIPNTAAAD